MLHRDFVTLQYRHIYTHSNAHEHVILLTIQQNSNVHINFDFEFREQAMLHFFIEHRTRDGQHEAIELHITFDRYPWVDMHFTNCSCLLFLFVHVSECLLDLSLKIGYICNILCINLRLNMFLFSVKASSLINKN